MKAKLAITTIGLLACLSSASAQTTQLTQTAAGPNCHTYGCINTPLSDGEVFTWCHVTTGSGCTKLSFRGLNYFMTAHVAGFPLEAVDLTSTSDENNGFAVYTDFLCGRFGCGWHDGYLQLNNEYVGSDPFLYGWNGSVNVTSGTGQVGLATANMVSNTTVTLASSNPDILQVPASVTILAGSLDADFTITAVAPTATTNNQLAPIPVTVTATYPDNTAATMNVTVGPLPASPPTSSELHKPGTCWWDGNGASWKNIHCARRGQ